MDERQSEIKSGTVDATNKTEVLTDFLTKIVDDPNSEKVLIQCKSKDDCKGKNQCCAKIQLYRENIKEAATFYRCINGDAEEDQGNLLFADYFYDVQCIEESE